MCLLSSSDPPFTWLAFNFDCCLFYSLDTLVFPFLGFFAVYAVVAKAGRVVSHYIRLSLQEGMWTLIYLCRAANSNTHFLKWPVTGRQCPSRSLFSEARIQSHGEVRMSSLSDHLNYSLLKGYYGIFAQWHQTLTTYLSYDKSTSWKVWVGVD